MQEAIPFRTYIPAAGGGDSRGGGGNVQVSSSNVGGNNSVEKLVVENSVIVFGKSGCCMCHVVKRLLLGLGVNPAVLEVEEKEEAAVMSELWRINGEKDSGGNKNGEFQFPVVFVGGKLFGGLERVMATHISGELVPILKDAGALWL